MALGIFRTSGSISTNTDTAVIAAPGAGQRIYILWMTVTVEAAGTSSRLRVEDGTGGGVVARMATATADALLNINYSGHDRETSGRSLSVNTALNFNTSGTAAATLNYDIAYMVRG
jgi:hypothetical protein